MDMVQIFLDAEDIDMARPDNTGGTYLMAFVNDRARPEIVHAVAKKMTLEQRNVQRDGSLFRSRTGFWETALI
jgi:hypothetical protein